MKNTLELKNITKKYEGEALLRGISMTIKPGETVCLLGRSGSGKSTLLRVIAGLEEPDGGQVCWEGTDLAGVPAFRRNFGLMFQDYALFPHLNVAQNVAFGLRMRGGKESEISSIVMEALERVNMVDFARRRVTDLSGGEQQRIALARAFAPNPRLLMLDEPLAALDRALRQELQHELRSVLRQTRIPVVYVTHDQEEALFLGDRLAILEDGQIEQVGTPEEVFQNPSNPRVAMFLGLTNLVNGKVLHSNPLVVSTELGNFQVGANPNAPLKASEEVTLLLRPVGILLNGVPSAENTITGTVVDCVFKGDSFDVSFQAQGSKNLRFFVSEPLQPGIIASVQVPPGLVHAFKV